MPYFMLRASVCVCVFERERATTPVCVCCLDSCTSILSHLKGWWALYVWFWFEGCFLFRFGILTLDKETGQGVPGGSNFQRLQVTLTRSLVPLFRNENLESFLFVCPVPSRLFTFIGGGSDTPFESAFPFVHFLLMSRFE